MSLKSDQLELGFSIQTTVLSSNYTPYNGRDSLADPESFPRGGPTLITLFIVLVDKGGRKDQNTTTITGHHRPSSETPFKWRSAGMPMMAQHGMLVR